MILCFKFEKCNWVQLKNQSRDGKKNASGLANAHPKSPIINWQKASGIFLLSIFSKHTFVPIQIRGGDSSMVWCNDLVSTFISLVIA